MWALLLAAQAAAAPDIQLGARVQARELTIERKGESRLEVRAQPEGGSRVVVEAPRAEGRRRLRNIDVKVNAEARIGPETAPAPPR